jgi:hypothetical protein
MHVRQKVVEDLVIYDYRNHRQSKVVPGGQLDFDTLSFTEHGDVTVPYIYPQLASHSSRAAVHVTPRLSE